MRKQVAIGLFALAFMGSAALAQSGAPSTVSGGASGAKDNANPSAAMVKHEGGAKSSGTTTGMSSQDKKTIPGSLTSGGSSEGNPNTAQPGASKQGN